MLNKKSTSAVRSLKSSLGVAHFKILGIKTNIGTKPEWHQYYVYGKKTQIKIDKDASACAIYISGKLIDLSIPYGWHYFYIFDYRIDSDDVFIAFLNAFACETEEEFDYFKPLLENFISNLRSSENGYWKKVINKLNEEISKADDSKIRSSYRSIEIVYKQKLTMFVRNKDEFFYVNNMQISKSIDMFLYFHKAA